MLPQAALRALLASRHVGVDEQQATWHAADGRAGPLYYADEAMYHAVLSAAAAAVVPPPPSGGGGGAGPAGGGGELAPDDIDGWLRMREQARAKRALLTVLTLLTLLTVLTVLTLPTPRPLLTR